MTPYLHCFLWVADEESKIIHCGGLRYSGIIRYWNLVFSGPHSSDCESLCGKKAQLQVSPSLVLEPLKQKSETEVTTTLG